MEKQLLFLLDYDLAISESEICHYARPFLEQYTFEPEIPRAAMATPPCTPPDLPLPVTPRLPSGETCYYADVDDAPSLDRSDSTSSIGSDGPVTPASSQASPLSRRHDVVDEHQHHLSAVPTTKDARQYVRRLFGRRASTAAV